MKFTRFVGFIFAIAILHGCSSSSDTNTGSSNTNTGSNDDGVVQAFSVDCSASEAHVPSTDPVKMDAVGGSATTTIIVMHWKTGTPTDAEISDLSIALSNAGYDVIAPYMPWNGTGWDGSMCEAINYIKSLADQEAAKSKNIIIAGHGMGGTHALIFGTAIPTNVVKGLVILAPGHIPHLFDERQDQIADDIATAEDEVASGNGDDMGFYDSYRVSGPITIYISANDYLSYHALEQFPDIADVLPAIKLPVLWLAGQDDPLTTSLAMDILFSRITSKDSEYKLVPGDHLTMVTMSATDFVNWLGTLGL